MLGHHPTPFFPSVETRIVEDIDSIAMAMADGIRGEYVQLEPNQFGGRWTTVRFNTIVVQFGCANVAVARRVVAPADRWLFMVPLTVSSEARWNAHVMRADDIIACPPGTECLAFDPAATRFAIITANLSSAVAAAAQRLFSTRNASALAATCGGEALTLRNRLKQLRARAESEHVTPLTRFDDCLHQHLARCLERSAQAHGEVTADGGRSRIVGRAEEFFRTHVSEGVSVAKLSSVVGVSERSLRNAFYDVYTTSPKRYMKLWQLHQVRRALRAAGGATVTEVATCHGLYELGRFAGAYKSLFGEAPSETLNKTRARATMLGAA